MDQKKDRTGLSCSTAFRRFLGILFTLLKIAYFFLAVLMALSCLSELFMQCSLLERVAPASQLALYKRFSPALSAKSIFEVARIIGLGSIFLTWVYNELDKKILGLNGRYILNRHKKSTYKWFLCIHLSAVIICIWASSGDMLEASILSLCILLISCLYHLNVVVNLVFDPHARLGLAAEVYEADMRRGKDGLNTVLFRLCDELNLSTAQEERVLFCFVRGLVRHVDLSDIPRSIESLQRVWAYFCVKRTQDELLVLILQIFRAIRKTKLDDLGAYGNPKNRNELQLIIMLSYFVSRWKHHFADPKLVKWEKPGMNTVELSDESELSQNPAFIRLMNEMACLSDALSSSQAKGSTAEPDGACFVFAPLLLSFCHFFAGNAALDEDLIYSWQNQVPRFDRSQESHRDIYYNMCAACINGLDRPQDKEWVFDCAWDLMQAQIEPEQEVMQC